MAKSKTQFVCSECGYASAKWLGKCPDCDSWNTMEERASETAAAPKLKHFNESLMVNLSAGRNRQRSKKPIGLF